MMLAAFEMRRICAAKRFAALAQRALRVAILYMPAALAFMLLKPHSSGDCHMAFNLLDTMLDRFESLIQHAFDSPAYILPVLLFGGLASGDLALARRAASRHVWLALALLLAASLLAPEWALGGWAVHLRLPAVFAACCSPPPSCRCSRGCATGLAVLALAAIAASALYLAR